MHPAFIGAQYPFSMATGPQPPMAATAVTFPGVPVPSMTQIAVHPYHAETGLPLSTTVTGPEPFLCYPTVNLNLLDIVSAELGIATLKMNLVMFHSGQRPFGPHYPEYARSISPVDLLTARFIGQHAVPRGG